MEHFVFYKTAAVWNIEKLGLVDRTGEQCGPWKIPNRTMF
jgi:hypothetical protein